MQRLLTIFYFFGGRYGKKGLHESSQEFRITGINKGNRIYGKRFDDLPEYIQRELKSQVLRSILIRQDPPGTGGINSTVVHHIFERLNTGGTALSEQEIRNCVYSGKFNDLLHDINSDKDWRKILGKPFSDPRMSDLQLALRCIALVHQGDKYKKPMKDFLSKFMHDMRNPADDFVLQEKERFGNVCRSIVDHLGERPFHNPRGVLRGPPLRFRICGVCAQCRRCPGRHKKEGRQPQEKPPVRVVIGCGRYGRVCGRKTPRGRQQGAVRVMAYDTRCSRQRSGYVERSPRQGGAPTHDH